MNTPQEILMQFEPIGLKEMDGVKLMNRTDTKFLFTMEQFSAVLTDVLEYYRVLEINSKRSGLYKTLYYDTENLNLYSNHHNGKLNRYKIRHRTYADSDLGFLEVKFKNNKGRTIKNRIEEHYPPNTWEGESEMFLKKTLPFDPQTLIPVLWVNYNRHTLVHKTEAERLTIDMNLEFIKDGVIKRLDNLVIAEVKQDKKKVSPFIKMMKKYHIREGSISKYCMGMALTNDKVKTNNFKSKLLTLKHILNDGLAANC